MMKLPQKEISCCNMLHELLIMSIIMFMILNGSSASWLEECSHLRQGPDQNHNAYTPQNVHYNCCMCEAGKFVERDCSAGDPMSTVCTICGPGTYISYGPHNRYECFHDTVTCHEPFVYKKGNTTSVSSCECPSGTKRISRYECSEPEAVGLEEKGNDNTDTVVSLAITPTLISKGDNNISEHGNTENTTAISEIIFNPSSISPETDEILVHSNFSSQGDYNIPEHGNTENTTAISEIIFNPSSVSPETDEKIVHSNSLSPESLIIIIGASAIAVLSCVIACCLIHRKKKRRSSKLSIDLEAAIPMDTLPPPESNHSDVTSNNRSSVIVDEEIEGADDEANGTNIDNMESINGDDSEEAEPFLSDTDENSPRNGDNDDMLPEKKDKEKLLMEYENLYGKGDDQIEEIMSINDELSSINNKAGPQYGPNDAERPLLSRVEPLDRRPISDRVQNNVQNVDLNPPVALNISPGNNGISLRNQNEQQSASVPLQQQQERRTAPITNFHKQKRQEGLNEIAGVINHRDLNRISRMLGLSEVERDDIEKQTIGDTPERAQQIFRRATQLDPNLTLYNLLAHVEGLGYLKEVIQDKIDELEIIEPRRMD